MTYWRGTPTGAADINLAIDTFHGTFTDAIPLLHKIGVAGCAGELNGVGGLQEAASLQVANDSVFEVRRIGNAQ